jgi:hypothetical protein
MEQGASGSRLDECIAAYGLRGCNTITGEPYRRVSQATLKANAATLDAVSAEEQQRWNGVPGFAGLWVAESGGKCIGGPYTFWPKGDTIEFVTADGSVDLVNTVADVDPPTLISGSHTMVLQPDGLIRDSGAEGFHCFLRRDPAGAR